MMVAALDLHQYADLVLLAVNSGQTATAAREWAEEVIAQEKGLKMFRIGTSHFVTKARAVRYYRAYEGDNAAAAVERKLKEGEIHIGPPPLKPGEKLVVVDNGTRYEIQINAGPDGKPFLDGRGSP